MNEVLAAGVARRTPTAADLNIPEEPDGADPERAALPAPNETSTAVHQKTDAASTLHTLPPAVSFDPALATALAYSSAANSDARTALTPYQDSALTVPHQLAAVLAGNADGPRSNVIDGSEASRGMDSHSVDTYNDDEFETLPDTMPVPVLKNGAESSEVPIAAPAFSPEGATSAPLLNLDAPVGDSALLSRLYDGTGTDGCWAAAFAGSDSPLLAPSVVESGMNDVPVALAVVFGGLWLAPTAATERRWDRNPGASLRIELDAGMI
jgi:hypothetical protein